MTDTEKTGCRLIVECMEAYGIRHVVTSPGSRNAPLIMAFSRRNTFKVHSVIDERSAAFIALGIAEITGDPVALVCTSGTAVLNYSPALAEAFYRNLPLIAISADRPVEWIDQNDSQTIRQAGALSNIVRKSIDIRAELFSEEEIWYANRILNDAMHSALYGVRGPVHINVGLSMPLTNTISVDGNTQITRFNKIGWIGYSDRISTSLARDLASHCIDKRIMIVCSVQEPDASLNRALGQLASLPNVVVVAEETANIHAKGIHSQCDLLFALTREKEYDILSPDLLISFGGSIVSANLKRFLRNPRITEHWHVGETDRSIDCFKKLSTRVEISPVGFFPRFASAMSHLCKYQNCPNEYAAIWSGHARNILDSVKNRLKIQYKTAPWNALLIIDKIINSIPSCWNLQLSNGMSVRYALACDKTNKMHRIDCNRGVSGIDGSISTAIGAASVFNGVTLLITGDMSMQYDIGALSSNLLSNRIKIIVFNNGGGGIFKFVKTTCNLPERDKYFCCGNNLPLEKIADAYGFKYFKAKCMEELENSLKDFIETNTVPVILEVFTDSTTDTRAYREISGE